MEVVPAVSVTHHQTEARPTDEEPVIVSVKNSPATAVVDDTERDTVGAVWAFTDST